MPVALPRVSVTRNPRRRNSPAVTPDGSYWSTCDVVREERRADRGGKGTGDGQRQSPHHRFISANTPQPRYSRVKAA